MTQMSGLDAQSKGKMFIKCVAHILLTLNCKYDLASDNYPEKSLSKLNIELVFCFCFLFYFMFLSFYLGSKNGVLN